MSVREKERVIIRQTDVSVCARESTCVWRETERQTDREIERERQKVRERHTQRVTPARDPFKYADREWCKITMVCVGVVLLHRCCWYVLA